MAFRFPLEPLLRLRRSLERQEEQRLYALAATVNRIRNQMEELERSSVAVQRLLLEAGLSGASLQYIAHCAACAAATKKNLQSQLLEAERRRQDQLRSYQAARQQREILEGLREREEAVYAQRRSRKERELTDEVFLIRQFLSSTE